MNNKKWGYLCWLEIGVRTFIGIFAILVAGCDFQLVFSIYPLFSIDLCPRCRRGVGDRRRFRQIIRGVCMSFCVVMSLDLLDRRV
jgi:hypothetical protein